MSNEKLAVPGQKIMCSFQGVVCVSDSEAKTLSLLDPTTEEDPCDCLPGAENYEGVCVCVCVC